MKGKRMESLLLTTMLIVGMLGILGGSVKAQNPYLDTWPDPVEYLNTVPCEYNNSAFDLEVVVNGVTDCYGVDFWMTYNTTLLEKTGPVDEVGPFTSGNPKIIPPQSGGYFKTELSIAGTVKVSITFVGAVGADSFNGTGTVCSIPFKVIYCPEQLSGPTQVNNTASCDLAFDETKVKIWDRLGGAQTRDPSVDGYYEITTIGYVLGEPIADFTSSPLPANVYVGDTVTLTDTSDPGGVGITIVSWSWSLVGNATLTGPANTAVTTFHCDDIGDVYVTLFVVNSDANNDTVTKVIPQKKKVGAVFDLYTSENRFCGQTTTNVGMGLDAPCDALSPDVNVTLFVDASWNGKPVMHVLVAFVVLDNNGDCVLYRTAETDKDGIARVWFRVPNPCTGSLFGKWIAYATGKIQEVKQEDTMPFDVGYAITLLDAWTIDGTGGPADTFQAPCDYLGVGLTYKNIMMIPKEVTFIFVVYDDCDVPIGQVIYNTTVAGGEYCSPNEDTILISELLHLPQWTYVGVGKVYVSAFTRLPQDCGVPYCPEVSYEFSLEWSGSTGP